MIFLMNILKNGLLNPVVLHEDKVLDGRNRLLACSQAGVDPSFIEWAGDGQSTTSWVIALNLKRRHLTPGQRAAVAVDSKPLLEAEAKQRQREHGGTAPGKPKKHLYHFDTSERRPPVSREVAKQFDVSQGYVYAAQKIKDKDEKVFQQVKSGTMSIPEAEAKLGFKQSTKILVSSDSNEWYTPKNYIHAVREVLSDIDLDPASCELANTVVKATRFITKEENGLHGHWEGKVFLNPPYGDVGPKFVEKLQREYEAGRVKEAILLVNSHGTDSKWFQGLFSYPVCFTDHRSRFWNEDGVGGSPTHGSAFVYLGKHKSKFAQVFSNFGVPLEKIRLT